MRVFTIGFPQNCELVYPASLPGGKCPVCGRFYPNSLCAYPWIDFKKVKPLVDPYGKSVIPIQDFLRMRSEIRSLFPSYAFIGSGTEFGTPTGRIFFKHKDMLFSSNGILVTDNGLDDLKKSGVSGIYPTRISLRHGKSPPVHLHILEFEPLAEEPDYAFGEPCKACGLRKRINQCRGAVLRKSWGEQIDLSGFRTEGFRNVIVSEKFRELALKLHGGNGLKFGELPIVD